MATIGPGLGLAPLHAGSIGSYGIEVQSLLEEVDLSCAAGVSDEVVVSLVRNCPYMQVLKAAHAHRLTAASTTAVALFCPAIRELRLEFCDGVCSPLFNLEIASSLAE